MRWNVFVAFGVVALAGIAAVVVACSDSSNCKPNEFQLQIELSGTAALADTITITSNDPGAMISQTVPHTPNGDTYFSVDLDFPGGYPADKLVNLTVKATGGVTLLGETVVQIHTDPTCTVGHAFIMAQPPDMSDVD